MIIHCFIPVLFFLAATVNSPGEARSHRKTASVSSANNMSQRALKNQKVQLGGVLIVFNKWPGKKEKKKILLETKKGELKIAEKVSKPKMWSFEWLNSKNNSLENFSSFKTALDVCEKLENLRSIKYCRLEFIPILHKGFSQSTPLVPRQGINSCEEKIFDLGKEKINTPVSDKDPPPPKRHSFWGQKMIGSDLAKEEMEGVNNLPSNSQNLLSVFDGAIDIGPGTHKELVQNMAVGNGKQAVSEPAGVETYYNYKRIQEYVSDFEKEYLSCSSRSNRKACQNTHYPAIANLSFGIMDSDHFNKTLENFYQENTTKLSHNQPFYSKLVGKVVSSDKDRNELTALLRTIRENLDSPTPFYLKQDQAIEKMNERGTLLVQAAGNKGNEPIDSYTVKAAGYGAIVVGGVNSRGERYEVSQNNGSQRGDSVFITGPGEGVTAANDRGEFHQLNGTSLATPMVSGSLRNFILGSGHRLTSDEAKALMKETAIPHNAGPGNGVGIVNAYKIAMVGKRLHEICGNNERCKSHRIKEEGGSLYRFKTDPNILKEVEMYFPQCASKSSNPFSVLCDRNCDKKANLLKKLRKEFLLNPENTLLAEYLACIYSSHGYEETAAFYLRSGRYMHLQQALRCHGLPKSPQEGRQTQTRGSTVTQ